jgi:predicted phosphodiesterase
MKALILSDLHMKPEIFNSDFHMLKYKRILKLNHITSDKYDIVLISGDVVESSIINNTAINPLNTLYNLFEKPVIFCLGNHEFAFKKHSDVIDYWSKWKHENIHCLDIDGHVQIDNYNFVGNVLWYDWSLNNCYQLMHGEILDGWLDATIKDFDPIKENLKCQEQIFNNLSYDKSINNILITHMVSHIDLNTFSYEQPNSPYNAYSGMKRFILDIQDKGVNLTHAICGHTHRREMKTIWNIDCINIGNDYYHRTNNIAYYILDLD